MSEGKATEQKDVWVDLRFAELEYELGVLERYIDLVGAHLPDIVESERQSLTLLYKDVPEADRGGLAFLEHDLDQGVPTRMFAAASIMGLWAVYEASVLTVASKIRKARGIALEMSDLRGSFIQQARHYFRDVVQFDLHPTEAIWQTLRDIAEIRNAFAHANGLAEHMAASKFERLRNISARYEGLRVVNETHLVVELSLAREFHRVISAELNRLFERVRLAIR